MFTDMVGYSRKVLEDEAKTMQLLATHNGILEGRINAHNGNVIKTINDAFLADFDSAVNCAVDIQEELVDLNKGKTEVRIGIHVGDVIYRENDVFGFTKFCGIPREPTKRRSWHLQSPACPE